MSAATRSDLLRLLRAFAAAAGFAALAAGVALLVLFEVARNGNVVENGPVELAQIALLAFASLAYALRARAANAAGGPARAFVLCSLLVLAMTVRELDGFLDQAFFHGAWIPIVAAILAACGAVVSVNTGPMHVADAMGLPLVVLDGASRLPLWAPEGPRSVVLQHQDRVPGAPFHPTASNGAAVQRAVMALVAPDEVLALPFLSSPRA